MNHMNAFFLHEKYLVKMITVSSTVLIYHDFLSKMKINSIKTKTVYKAYIWGRFYQVFD